MDYQFFYINLEHRKDRNKKMIQRLKSNNLNNYLRINGIYKKDYGPIGCGKSHIKCLELAIKMDLPEVIIMEDDIIIKNNLVKDYFNYIKSFRIPKQKKVFLEDKDEFNIKMCDRFGLRIIETLNEKCFRIPKSIKIIKNLNEIEYQELSIYKNKYKNNILAKNKFTYSIKKNYYLLKDIYNNLEFNSEIWDVIILSGHGEKKDLDNTISRAKSIQTAGMYLIKRHYYNILLENFRQSVKKMEYLIKRGLDINYIENGIDQNWKKLQKKDNWFIFNKNLGYQEKDYSDIEKKYVDYTYCLN